MKYAIVDIETTGSQAGKGRITEIAVYVHDGKQIVDEFCSLINPECTIPPFIAKLTGISNEMVETAPKFYEVAKQLVTITEGAVFVAHNASFDYHFIRHEYQSLGYNYTRDYLCTLQLSRKMLPGYRSYSLGNLCGTLNINLQNRHRAHGDALATVKLFELLMAKGHTADYLQEFIRNDFINLRFPPGFNRSVIDTLPEKAGVYYLHDSLGKVVYIGKSKNIKKRVLSHFSNKRGKRYVDLRNAIADVSFEVTGSELIALLLESEEIKNRRPFYNRKQKRVFLNHHLLATVNKAGYLNLKISRQPGDEQSICTVNSYEEGEAIIDKLLLRYGLCRKFCGADDIKNACFGYSVKQCRGACLGLESPEDYNERAEQAIASLQFGEKNFFIFGRGRQENEKSVIQVERGVYMGYGYFDPDLTAPRPECLADCIKSRNDNRDIRQILSGHLKRIPADDLLRY